MACELLNAPPQWILFRYISHVSGGCFKVGMLHIIRYWNKNIYIVCNAFLLVVRLHLYEEPDLSVWWFLNNNIDWEERFHFGIKSVAHELKLSIRRNECDQSLILESSKTDALVELNITEFHSFVLWCSALSLIIGFVIETQLKVWHARELTVCLHISNNLGFDDIVRWTNEHWQLFDDIQVKFIFGVLDALPSPRNNIGNLFDCFQGVVSVPLDKFREGILQLVWLCLDILLEQLDFGCLRIAIIHHLIKKFVNENKVVSHWFLLSALEIGIQNTDKSMDESENHHSVVVLPWNGHYVQIVMLVEIEHVVLLVLDYRSESNRVYLRVYSSYSRIFLLKIS